MARLILSLQGQSLAEYNMGKERYTIGRLSDNDVRIDNPAVSGHHALIINILNDSFLEDLNSTNGTYVNGKLIKKHALQHGDVVTVGHHQLRFIDSQVEEAGGEDFAKTLVIQSGDATDDRLPALAIRKPGHGAEAATGAPVSSSVTPPTATTGHGGPAKLQVLSGALAGKELELTKVVTTLGRPGVQVAAITRRGDTCFLVPVDGGTAGTLPEINGQLVGPQAHRLQDGDVITLAGVKMGFFLS